MGCIGWTKGKRMVFLTSHVQKYLDSLDVPSPIFGFLKLLSGNQFWKKKKENGGEAAKKKKKRKKKEKEKSKKKKKHAHTPPYL